MLPQLIKYIQNHANRWPIKLRVDSQLIPLLRFNKEANRIVKSEQIGVVIFWFNRRKRNPCLVTKIMDRSLSVEYIRSCAGHQQEINKKIGISVFPSIYDVAQISGYPVIFQEAINTQNYEMELSKAIYGPTGNLRLLKEVVNCHFEEIGSLFNKLKMIDVSEEITQWGDWAYSVGDDLRNNYGLRLEFLTDNCLDRMRREINSMSLQRNYVLVDHYAANYFRGPRIVDQIDRSLSKRMSNEPGIIDVFRFIIAYFRTSLLNFIYKDWLDAIACSIMDKDGLILTGPPVRKLLRDIGLNLDEPKKIWALVMVSFFLRAIDELTFHQHNIFLISRLRTEFEQLTKRLIEIQDLIEKNGDFDFSFALGSQESFIPPSKPVLTDNFIQPPCLIEEGYEDFNIVLYGEKYYALAQSLGPVDFTCLGENKIKEYQDGGKWFMGDSLEETKRFVDEIVNRGEQKEAGEAPREMEIIAKAISNMEENIRKLVFDMGEKDKRIDILERELSEERNSYRKLSEDLENREKTIEALIRHVSDRDDNIKRLMTGLEEESKDLNSVQKELEERDKRIQVQNERLTEKDERIGTLEKELVELDKSIDLLREEVSDKETKINILRGVNVSFSAVPVFLDSYEGYNLMQFKDRIYGILQALGHLDLLKEGESLAEYEKDGRCVVSDSVSEVKHLIGRILHQDLEKGVLERDTRIEVLEKEVTDRNLRIDGLQKELSERNGNIKELTEELEEVEKRIEVMQGEVGERDKSIEALSKELEYRDKRIEVLQKEVGDRDSRIDGLQNEVSEKNRYIKGLTDELEIKDREVETLKKEVSDRDTRIKDFQGSVSEKEAEIHSLKSEILDRDSKIEGLQKGVLEKAENIRKLNADISESFVKIEGLQKEIIERDSRIDGLQNEVSDRDGNIKVLTEKLEGYSKKIETLQAEITVREKNIGALKRDISHRDENIVKLNAEIQAHSERIGVLEKEVTDRNLRIDGLQKEAVKKENNIAKLNIEVKECNKKIENLEVDILSKNRNIETLKKDISNRDKNIVKLSNDIEAHNKNINTLQEHLLEKDKNIEALNIGISKKEEEISKLNNESAVMGSYIKELQEELVDIKSKWWFKFLNRKS